MNSPAYPENFVLIMICTGKSVQSISQKQFKKARLLYLTFLGLSLIFMSLVHLRITKFVREEVQGSIKRVGLRYRRSVVNYRQCLRKALQFVFFRLVGEVLILVLYNNPDFAQDSGNKIIFYFYLIKEVLISADLVYNLIICRREYQVLWSERNITEKIEVLSVLSSLQGVLPHPTLTPFIR
ncbi:uncharacterized protein LOC111702095 [Eurytemora carolleeae]|uniref:uncharacterized protein LOC111702095 n=1 Tax=Eurytemora carolleeae TaxID=1294199 RepID=UPI000C75F4A2|nr:uncharacterized protein LOC111702095 [Eurytemora carolleeae]|eukprot:XP_023329431.1 uncharacterized protein LOC111702095 [Eurytemora affinis]